MNYPCLVKSYHFSLSLSYFQICHQTVTCNLHKITYLPLKGHNNVTTHYRTLGLLILSTTTELSSILRPDKLELAQLSQNSYESMYLQLHCTKTRHHNKPVNQDCWLIHNSIQTKMAAGNHESLYMLLWSPTASQFASSHETLPSNFPLCCQVIVKPACCNLMYESNAFVKCLWKYKSLTMHLYEMVSSACELSYMV